MGDLPVIGWIAEVTEVTRTLLLSNRMATAMASPRRMAIPIYRLTTDVPKFNYGGTVKIRVDASDELRPGSRAWIVGVFETRPGPYFDKFPPGIVYTVEYEDGSAQQVHESNLESALD